MKIKKDGENLYFFDILHKKLGENMKVSKPTVICLGEILFDCLADEVAVSWEEVNSYSSYPGGAIANVACALVKLGTTAAYVGSIGADSAGRELKQLLETVGVDTTGVFIHPSAPTRQVYVLRSAEGDRLFAGFGEQPPDIFADAYLSPNDLPEELFVNGEFLVLGTLELAYPLTCEAIWRSIELADSYDLKIVLDVNWRPMFWPDPDAAKPMIQKLIKSVDFLKLSAEEALWLFDTKDAGAIVHRFGTLEGAIVTNGAEAVSYCLSDSEGKVNPPVFPVVDTTGAGDSFVAGFIHQLCQRGIGCLENPEQAKEIVNYACIVGGLTTTKPGAIDAQPTPEEVEAYLGLLKN